LLQRPLRQAVAFDPPVDPPSLQIEDVLRSDVSFWKAQSKLGSTTMFISKDVYGIFVACPPAAEFVVLTKSCIKPPIICSVSSSVHISFHFFHLYHSAPRIFISKSRSIEQTYRVNIFTSNRTTAYWPHAVNTQRPEFCCNRMSLGNERRRQIVILSSPESSVAR